LWNLNEPSKPVLVTPAQSDEVYGVSFLPGDETFLIGLRNGEVSAWDATQGKMISPGTIAAKQEAVYTIALSPDQSRVVIVSRDANVRGHPRSRWLADVDSQWSSADLKKLGEVIASQELHDGVLAGLTNESVMQRWATLFQSYSDHPIFRWANSTNPKAIASSETLSTEAKNE
jgi:WD40 repeat protein